MCAPPDSCASKYNEVFNFASSQRFSRTFMEYTKLFCLLDAHSIKRLTSSGRIRSFRPLFSISRSGSWKASCLSNKILRNMVIVRLGGWGHQRGSARGRSEHNASVALGDTPLYVYKLVFSAESVRQIGYLYLVLVDCLQAVAYRN